MPDPLPSNFWTFTIGNVVTALLFAGGLVYGASAFATKSNSDAESDKVIARSLKDRIELVDSRQKELAGRVVAVETAIPYIRESLIRIENAVTRNPPHP